MSAIERVELKSCPFCGGEAQPATVVAAGIEWAHVECVEADCDAVGPAKPTEAEAIAAWNTALAKSAGQGDVVERMKAELARQNVPMAAFGPAGEHSVVIYNSAAVDLEALASAAVPAGAEMREAELLDEAKEGLEALLELWDSYQESDLNQMNAHDCLVRYEVWDKARATLIKLEAQPLQRREKRDDARPMPKKHLKSRKRAQRGCGEA